MLEVDAQ
jgi:hypothetical protein